MDTRTPLERLFFHISPVSLRCLLRQLDAALPAAATSDAAAGMREAAHEMFLAYQSRDVVEAAAAVRAVVVHFATAGATRRDGQYAPGADAVPAGRRRNSKRR
jgi:hypothetical protein